MAEPETAAKPPQSEEDKTATPSPDKSGKKDLTLLEMQKARQE